MVTYGNAYRMHAADDLDVSKFENLEENLAIINSDSAYITDARPMDKMDKPIALKLWNLTRRSYSFQFQAEHMQDKGLNAWINDEYLHNRTPVSLNGDVTTMEFDITEDPASKAEKRFSIIFESTAAASGQLTEATAANITIYPNPLQGRRLTIRMQSMPKDRYTMQLFNNEGKRVISRHFNHTGNAADFKFDMRSLPAGHYQVSLQARGNPLRSQTLIVQ